LTATPGQHMLEEAVDAGLGRERQTCPPGAAPLREAERDVPVCKRFQAVVGEGNPVNVRSEGGQDRRARTRRLAVGHPGLVPDLGRHGLAEARGRQGGLALAPEEPGARAHGYEPGLTAGGEPLRALWRQGPTRDEGMARRMGGQVPGPRVEDTPHAALSTAGVGGQSQGKAAAEV
jgi:hypothetical protein